MPSHDPAKLAKCIAEPDFGASQWEFLLEQVASKDESTLESATEALENCGELPVSELSTLASLLGGNGPHPLGSQRLYWICTLVARFGAQAQGMQDAIARICCDPTVELHARERAAWCLGEIGPLKPSVDALLQSQHDVASERWKRLVDIARKTGAVAG
jgi:hypothetical protein